MTLKILNNYIKYSGVWVSFIFNPLHWNFKYEFMQPDSLNPKMHGFYIALAMVTLRVVIDDGSW